MLGSDTVVQAGKAKEEGKKKNKVLPRVRGNTNWRNLKIENHKNSPSFILHLQTTKTINNVATISPRDYRRCKGPTRSGAS